MAFWGTSGKPKKFLFTIPLKNSSSDSANIPRCINFVGVQQNRYYSADEPPKSPVKGKIAIITGGARGIGLNIAERLLQEEAEAVILGDILIQEMETATFTLNDKYGEHRALFQPTDVSKTKQMEKLFKCTKDRFGRVDIVINNAGILNNQNFEECINVNIKGLVRGTFLAFQYMSGKGGVIINNAGLEGFQPLYASPVYCGTNHFVIGFSRSMGHDYFYKNTKVKVMAFCPGPTQTEFLKNVGKNGDDPMFPNMGQQLEKFFKQQPAQQTTYVAKGIISMLNDGENGSIWISKACKFYKIKVPSLDKLKPITEVPKTESLYKLPCPLSEKSKQIPNCGSKKTVKPKSDKTGKCAKQTLRSDKTGKCKKSEQNLQSSKSKSLQTDKRKSETAGKNKCAGLGSDKTGKCKNLEPSKSKSQQTDKKKPGTTGKDKCTGLRSDKTGKCKSLKQKLKPCIGKPQQTDKSRPGTLGKDKCVGSRSDKTGKCKNLEQNLQPSKSKYQQTDKRKPETTGKDKCTGSRSDKTGKCKSLEQKLKPCIGKPQQTDKSRPGTVGKDKCVGSRSDKTGKCTKSEQCAKPIPCKQASKTSEHQIKLKKLYKSNQDQIKPSQQRDNLDYILKAFNKSAASPKTFSDEQCKQKIPKEITVEPSKRKRKGSKRKQRGRKVEKLTQAREEKVDSCRKEEHWRKKIPCNFFKKPSEALKEESVCENIKSETQAKKPEHVLRNDLRKKGPSYPIKKTHTSSKTRSRQSKIKQGSSLVATKLMKLPEKSTEAPSAEPILKPLRNIIPTADFHPLEFEITELHRSGSNHIESKKTDSTTKLEAKINPIKKVYSSNEKLVLGVKPTEEADSRDIKRNIAAEENKNLDSEIKLSKKLEFSETSSKNLTKGTKILDLEVKPTEKADSIGTKTHATTEEKPDKTVSKKVTKAAEKFDSNINLPKKVIETLRKAEVDEIETFIIVKPKKKIKPGSKSDTMVSMFKEDGKKTTWVPPPSETFILKISSKSKPLKSSTKTCTDLKNTSDKKMFSSKSDTVEKINVSPSTEGKQTGKNVNKRPTPCNNPKFPKKSACPKIKLCEPPRASDEKQGSDVETDYYKLKSAKLKETVQKLETVTNNKKSSKELSAEKEKTSSKTDTTKNLKSEK